MLKIRLMRIGAKKKPFYRVVVLEERSKRTGGYIELLGTYNPLTEPKEINLKQDRIDYWVKMGAQLSVGFLRVIGKAPQRPPRKPKKEKKEELVKENKTGDVAKSEEIKPSEGEDIVASADQSPSNPPGGGVSQGESVADEPVAKGDASLTGEHDNGEPEIAKDEPEAGPANEKVTETTPAEEAVKEEEQHTPPEEVKNEGSA